MAGQSLLWPAKFSGECWGWIVVALRVRDDPSDRFGMVALTGNVLADEFIEPIEFVGIADLLSVPTPP